jgi:hypothetical protein
VGFDGCQRRNDDGIADKLGVVSRGENAADDDGLKAPFLSKNLPSPLAESGEYYVRHSTGGTDTDRAPGILPQDDKDKSDSIHVNSLEAASFYVHLF